MSSRAPGSKPGKSFYASIKGGKTELSRYRVYLQSKKSAPHWTFKAEYRGPRHGQQELYPSMELRHDRAVLEFCQELTSNKYSTRSNVDELSASVVSKAQKFESSPTKTGSKCRLWASNMDEYRDTKEIEFKIVVGDAVTYNADVGDESGLVGDAFTYKATVEDEPEPTQL